MKKLQALLLAGAVGTALMSTEAYATAIIQGTSDSFSIAGEFEGVPYGADVTVDFTTVEANNLLLDFEIFNSSPDNHPDPRENRLTSFGFNIDGVEVIIASASTDTSGWSATLDGNITSGLTVDVCVYSGNNCQAANDDGILPGQTLNIGVSLSGTFTPPLTFNGFVGRFASLGPDREGSGVAHPTNGTPVPEPATLALLGIGLLGAGYMARRRRDEA